MCERGESVCERERVRGRRRVVCEREGEGECGREERERV